MNNAITILSDEEMTKIKIVDLDKLYNFGSHHFSAEIIWCFKISLEHVIFLKFKNLNCSNFVERKELLNQHSNLIGHDFRKF